MVRFAYTSDPENKKLCTGSLTTYHPHYKAKIHNLKKNGKYIIMKKQNKIIYIHTT